MEGRRKGSPGGHLSSRVGSKLRSFASQEAEADYSSPETDVRHEAIKTEEGNLHRVVQERSSQRVSKAIAS